MCVQVFFIFCSVNIYLLPSWSGLGEESKGEELWVLRINTHTLAPKCFQAQSMCTLT